MLSNRPPVSEKLQRSLQQKETENAVVPAGNTEVALEPERLGTTKRFVLHGKNVNIDLGEGGVNF